MPVLVASGSRQAKGSHLDEDRHKAPSSTLPHPLSLQDGGAAGGPHIPESGRQVHQDGGGPLVALTFPNVVVKVHQGAGAACGPQNNVRVG